MDPSKHSTVMSKFFFLAQKLAMNIIAKKQLLITFLSNFINHLNDPLSVA
jgi:hypothetical protein